MFQNLTFKYKVIGPELIYNPSIGDSLLVVIFERSTYSRIAMSNDRWCYNINFLEQRPFFF